MERGGWSSLTPREISVRWWRGRREEKCRNIVALRSGFRVCSSPGPGEGEEGAWGWCSSRDGKRRQGQRKGWSEGRKGGAVGKNQTCRLNWG